MNLDEAKQILKNAGYLLEDTSIYSELSNFYRYLKVNAPKTCYDLKIEGDENNIIVKFMDNVAKVTLEQFDEDEDPMLYVEAGYDFKSFYNEHADYGNALQFIIKNICPTNEAKQILKNAGYIIESSMSLKDKIANAKQFNADIDKMKKDAVNIFKQAFYEEEVTDNGDDTYTVVPDSNYDITAIYKWDDNDTLTCKFNYSDNVLTFKHLSRHLNYDPKGGPWQEGQWSGDEELENFITDLSFEYQDAMSV